MSSVSTDVSRYIGAATKLADIWGKLIFNVKETAYGAKGDGTTDDTAAIQRAIDACRTAGGGEVRFPPGTYIYSGLLTPYSNMIFSGAAGASILKMKPGSLPTFGFFNIGNISNIIVRDLFFTGNSVAPAGTPGTASAAFFFLNCNNILFENCYFNKYMGIGIAFQGGTDTHVIKCKFEEHGQNLIPYRGLTPTAVPAVWAAYNNKGLKVVNCDFVDCRWSGVFMLGTYGLVDGCRMDHMGETGIYSEYSATSPTGHNTVVNNTIKDVYRVDVTACGIEWTTPYSVIANNTIQDVDASCIAITTASFVVTKNNVVSNANRTNVFGCSAIDIVMKGPLESVLPTFSKGFIVEGNICFDDRATNLQLHGIHVASYVGGTPMTQSSIVNNQMYRSVISDLNIEPGMMEDKSNIINLNGGMLDLMRDAIAVTLSTTVMTNLKVMNIRLNTLGKTKGIKITAWGSVTGTTGSKTIDFKFDTNDSAFATISYTAAENGQWRIEAYIYNQNATNVQNRSGITNKGATATPFNSAGAIDTTVDRSVAVIGTLANVADSIICNGLVVERI